MPLLSDGTIELRALEPYDLDLIYRWENDTDLWDAGPAIAPFSRDLLARYIESYVADIYVDKQLRLMVTVSSTGETVGTVDLTDFDPVHRRAAVGILIDSRWARRSYGTRALGIICSYAFERLGLHQLWATVGADNEASIRLFEKCGFRHYGRLRSWLRRSTGYVDAYLMQRLNSLPG